MALAVDVMHGIGPTNEMCRQLQPNKSEVSFIVLAIHIIFRSKRGFTRCKILTRHSTLVLNLGVSYKWQKKPGSLRCYNNFCLKQTLYCC